MSRPQADGEPTTPKLTDQAASRFIQGARLGYLLKECAALAGVSIGTARAWLLSGARGRGRRLTKLARDFEAAQAAFVGEALNGIMTAARGGDWNAWKYRLQLIDRERFLLPSKLEHAGDGGGPVETRDVEPRRMTTGERDRRLTELAARRAARTSGAFPSVSTPPDPVSTPDEE